MLIGKAVECLQNGTNIAKSQWSRITHLNMDELYKPSIGGGGMEEEDRFWKNAHVIPFV